MGGGQSADKHKKAQRRLIPAALFWYDEAKLQVPM
jgi:hypothetical protein